MKKQLLSILAAMTIAVICLPIAAKPQRNGRTLHNFQAAYNGESNAHARYLAFAEQADKEGYPPVGVLFRAAARAEEIHRTNHSAVIKQLGAIPKASMEKLSVRSTKDNLETSANKGEAYERDTMYPNFIKIAEAEGVPAAANSFRYAQESEAEHYNLFMHALDHLDKMHAAGVTYYVCGTSGYTAASMDAIYCPDSEYETIK
ncbi:MAG TPA: rubrerythrin family protein [Bryobacteraceae bacterium]|jgi:rubrerythrin